MLAAIRLHLVQYMNHSTCFGSRQQAVYLGLEVGNVFLGVAGLQLEVAPVDSQSSLHRHV